MSNYTDLKARLLKYHLSSVCLEAAAAITDLEAEVEKLRAERDALAAAKWAEKHTDTMNDMVQMGMARDEAVARAEAAEAKVEKLVEAAEGLSAILDQHETKGPLPDTALMFCWLAAQNVRAVLRGYMLENPE